MLRPLTRTVSMRLSNDGSQQVFVEKYGKLFLNYSCHPFLSGVMNDRISHDANHVLYRISRSSTGFPRILSTEL